MDYIVTKLITTEKETCFYLIGHAGDKKNAAALAAAEYKKFHPDASAQNVAMITEWLTMKLEYSFRRDKKNRIQLAISELSPETTEVPAARQLLFRCISEDELLQEVSARLCPDGKSQASR